MNILFIGSNSSLSLLPLNELINSNFNLCGIASDEKEKKNKLLNISIHNENSKSICEIASINNIPLIPLYKNISDNIKKITVLKPDLIIVSCYARKLPNEIIEIATIGCFNLHPSILPAYRGPTPLFWQFKNGEDVLGVSLHRVNEDLDKGNIIAQRTINKDNGIHLSKANEIISALAAELLMTALKLFSSSQYKEIEQDEVLASYHSFPTIKDYTLSVKWTAKHMYNFICATQSLGVNFICVIDDVQFFIKRADFFDMQNSINSSYIINNRNITIACSKGIIKCELANTPSL